MTYGTLFQSSTRQANQCSSRAVERALEPCRSGRETCRSRWDVHATSVSIPSGRSISAPSRRHSRAEDTIHGQASTQPDCCPSRACASSAHDIGRGAAGSDFRLPSSGRPEWLSGVSQSERCNWNTVLTAYSLGNCHRSINYWYPTDLGRLTTL